MNMRAIFLFLLCVPIFVLAHDDESAVVIHMTANGYVPQNIEIEAGTTVIFENIGEEEHWPASNIHPTHRMYPGTDISYCDDKNHDRDMFDSCGPLKKSEEFRFVFSEVGTWRYHDHLLPQIKGSITVLPSHKEAWIEEEKLGFWEGLLQKIRKIFGFNSEKEDTKITYSYNRWIKKDSTELFTDVDELYSYVRKFGTGETMRRINEIKMETGNSCHNMAHEVGRFSYEYYGGKSFEDCDALCQSGCYHGVIEAHFQENGIADLDRDLEYLCDERFNYFFTHQCVHGIGHGLMAWTDYDLPEALNACDRLSTEDQHSCYSGVFMENIVGGLSQEQGHFTEYLSDDPHYPCNILDGVYMEHCYFYQTTHMSTLFEEDFEKIAIACNEIENDASKHFCFASMGRDVGSRNTQNPFGIQKMCEYASEGSRYEACLTGAVQTMFWDVGEQDDVLWLCKLMREPEDKRLCYETISFRATEVIFNKKEQEVFCSRMDEIYRDRCLMVIDGSW